MYIQSQILQMQKQLIWNTQWQQSLHHQGKKYFYCVGKFLWFIQGTILKRINLNLEPILR